MVRLNILSFPTYLLMTFRPKSYSVTKRIETIFAGEQAQAVLCLLPYSWDLKFSIKLDMSWFALEVMLVKGVRG